MGTLMEKEIFETPNLLLDGSENCLLAVKKVADRITKDDIKKVFVASRGSSANAALYFRYSLEIDGQIPVFEVNPSVVTVYGSLPDMTDGILLVISQGGRGVDIRLVAEKAAEKGIPTVAVTADTESPIGRLCDYVIPLPIDKEQSMAATKSFTAEMYVLKMLSDEICGKPCNFENLAAAFSKALSLKEKVEALCLGYEYCGVLYVIGRGRTLPLAREMCCKLQETCLINAFPFSSADFMHGPFALADENARAILFHSKYGASESVLSLYSSLLEQGADVLLVSDDSAFEGQDDAIVVNSTSEDESVFAMTAVLQMFASSLSSIRGTNPDTSRNLNKYTETV